MKKYLLLAISLLLMTGCAINNKPAPKSNPNLPTVKNFKAYPDRNAMALFWDPVKNMSGYYIQRYSPKTKKWTQIATINDPYKSIYVDKKLKPNTIYKYRIATFDKNQVPSLAVETSQKTLPPLSAVIPVESKPLEKGMIKIIFRPHQNERVEEYKIQRFNDSKAKWETIGTLSPRLNVEFIDRGLKDGKIYKYRIIAISFDGIKSYPSKTIVVSTYPKPPVVLNLKASVDLPKKIKITWSPVPNAVAYKIYYSTSAQGAFSLLAKTQNTYYIDNIGKDGVKRFYKVTAVSKYGTESLLNESPVVMGMTLPAPAKPIVSTNITANQVEFIFTSPDNRAAKYLIIKKEKEGFLKYKTTKYVTSKNSFIDTINPKKEYEYEIYEVDKYGLISKKPAVVEIGG
ncbi:fibronectin type III domain-containing protein [Caminibacter pacificus]|uniref:Fibronectin type III domain-containing protein n=2 Tax=Caminibacter pacificus TaxID=1424653 RepID=A0ABX5TKP2_9BACT|nr:fibronectin type III domain-containing protein [Caminibacter pacificus]NPA87782.1 fibronectin type III domain-containing protein [Campylobacterota bacterium]QCI27849.1 fibronectin type III domain-containing protein [Caminibacter pacificus]